MMDTIKQSPRDSAALTSEISDNGHVVAHQDDALAG